MKKVIKLITIIMSIALIKKYLSKLNLRKVKVQYEEEKINEINCQLFELLNRRYENNKINKSSPFFESNVVIGACAITTNQMKRLPFSVKSKLFQRMPLEELKIIFLEVFGENIDFDETVFERILSKKVDKIVISKFLQTLENLYDNKVVFKKNPIVIDSSTKILEIQLLKDWRIYVKKNAAKYMVCNIGHKNTQIRDIKRLKTRFGKVAV